MAHSKLPLIEDIYDYFVFHAELHDGFVLRPNLQRAVDGVHHGGVPRPDVRQQGAPLRTLHRHLRSPFEVDL